MSPPELLDRRRWLASASTLMAGLLASTLMPATAAASAATRITVYKDPSCGCCTAWVKHLAANGFAPVARDRTDMDSLKDSLSIPTSLRSCHTALVGKFVVEGHVPAADIKRMLKKPPAGMIGLAVPDMPTGSPGMEAGGRVDRYDVIAFAANGKTRVFASHG